jgi:TatD DNase family protein
VRLFDAHNHLQDDRLKAHLPDIFPVLRDEGIAAMVVNGSSEEDWPDVLALAKAHPSLIVPSFGLHPWHVSTRSADWQRNLEQMLDAIPSAVGEIGLDEWILDRAKRKQRHEHAEELPEPAPMEVQEEIFVAQLRIAADRNLPVSIHCLQAWGRLIELLRRERRPVRGFVLHSFGGPKEMIQELAESGAYFSLPGYYAHERKERQREAFRHVPLHRLLIETDAPDQSLPDALNRYALTDAHGKSINHPGNLRAVYELAARITGTRLERVVEIVAENFARIFLPSMCH